MFHPSLSALPVACGQLIVGGFTGERAPASFAAALSRGTLGGAILFARNLTGHVAQVAELTAQLRAAAARDLPPPIVSIDQEGGRVARIPAPALVLPPMRALGDRGTPALAERVARAQARELAALGFTMNFAPVLDVDTNPANPVIGDRAFSSDAERVALFGAAYVRGLQSGGVLACGKHFPGHGDTALDSHYALPKVTHTLDRLDQVELVPFRAAIHAGVSSIMTAHILCSSLDAERPATLSRAACTTLLRGELGFEGVIVSDDLEMKAITDRYSIEEAATGAIDAGCDLLLICSDEALQERARVALVARAEEDTAFHARCQDALARVLRMRRRLPAQQALHVRELHTVVGGDESRRVAEELAKVMA